MNPHCLTICAAKRVSLAVPLPFSDRSSSASSKRLSSNRSHIAPFPRTSPAVFPAKPTKSGFNRSSHRSCAAHSQSAPRLQRTPPADSPSKPAKISFNRRSHRSLAAQAQRAPLAHTATAKKAYISLPAPHGQRLKSPLPQHIIEAIPSAPASIPPALYNVC